MRPLLEAELTAHAHALRALARLLVGEAHAEDLVQDTALHTLQAPPPRADGLRGWLSQVLRRLASNHRRGDSRRQRREGMVEPPRAPKSAARVAEHHEAVQRVTAALLALPEPYHGTLLLRFFEDLPPTAIAKVTGVPLATVKSRLQRGLQLLRERLGADAKGHDWRPALAAAFGLPPAAAVGAATSAATTGVFLMGSGVKLAVAGVAATVAVAAFFWLGPELPAVPATQQSAAAPTPVAATAPVAPPHTEVAAAPIDRREVPLTTPAPPSPGPRITLRGRCVDEQGQPIAGVSIRLTSNSRGAEQMDAWTKDHEVPKDLDEKLSTAPDGVFAFQFWPAPPQQFCLWLVADGRATMVGHLPMLIEGRTKDLGDVVMPRGVLLRGRVVDGDGVPVAKAFVGFAAGQRAVGEVVPHDNVQAQTLSDGTFVSNMALLPGDYGIQVKPGDKLTPDRIHIDGSHPIVDVNLMVDRPRTKDLPSIRGVVIDEAGHSVSGASVGVDGYTRLPGSLQESASSTDVDGRFVLRQRRGSPPEVSLLVRKDGFEELAPSDKFAWGRDDVRLVLRRGLAVEVRVVADDDGAPVEDFQVRVFPDPDQTEFGGDQYGVRSRGHHPGGSISIEGITRGDWCVLVEPKGDTLAMSKLTPVPVTDPGPGRVVVRLPRRVERPLHVQFADGSPVVGTRVEVADMRGKTPGADTWTQPLQSNLWAQRDTGLRLHDAVTDAHGEAVLQGPAGVALTLFFRGPGHVPMVQDGIRIDGDAPLVVTVSSGARLVGKVAPLSALAELRRLADLPESGALSAQRRGTLPGLRLVRFAQTTWQYHPKTESSSIAEDGAFTLAGVPDGHWDVTVTWFEPTNDTPAPGSYHGKQAIIGSVDLRDGATTEVTLDLSSLLPGELDGLVLHNDKPAANRRVQLTAIVGKSASGRDDQYARSVTTDAGGRFHLRTRPGDYQLSTATDRVMLHATDRAFVVAGQTSAQTFRLQSGRLRLRLLDAQDKPVRGVRIDACAQLTGPSPGWVWLGRTDADGITILEASILPLTLALLPKRLQDPKAQQQLLEKGGNADPFAGLRLELGQFTPKVGETTEVTLHLPPDWDR